MILILTNRADKLPARVMSALEAIDAPCVRFDTDAFPQEYRLSLIYDSAGFESRLHLPSGDTADLSEVTTVWYRRPAPVTPDPCLSADDQEFVSSESKHALSGLWHCLSDRFWVNPYQASMTAEHKPYQLKVARDLGLDTPRTIISNDPIQALQLFESCDHGMVYKTLTAFAMRSATVGEASSGIFTHRIAAAQLHRDLQRISQTPCLFQEYIPKAFELRVTVIGDRIFTARLDSQSVSAARDDWRRGFLFGGVPMQPATLPSEVEHQIRGLLRAMGLIFSCLDLIVTPDGRYVFLELNPNGQWDWVETMTGMPLMDAFVQMLAQADPHYREA